jgi:hypothetical protein
VTTQHANAATGTGAAVQERPAVPWPTVVLLAAAMSYADGFWIMSLRGAVGAIERTQEPFVGWLRESTAALPVFVLAVLGALALVLRWFGPEPSRPRTVLATGFVVVAAGTVVGIVETAASSAWDYVLQLRLMEVMHHSSTGDAVADPGQATLGLQLAALGYGCAIILATNVVVVGWLVAIRGGRLDAGTAPRAARWQVLDHRRLILAAALLGAAAIHAAVIPEHLEHWTAAGAFFLVLALAELAVGLNLLRAGRHTKPLYLAAAVSILPLCVWTCSRTMGLPFGPDAGIPESVGLADAAACALELGTVVIAAVLLRRAARSRAGSRSDGPTAASSHIRSLTVVAAIAVGVIGLTGTVPGWFGDAGSSGDITHSASH